MKTKKMRSMMTKMLVLVAVASASLAAKPAKADFLPLPTMNATEYGMWVTVYNLLDEQTDWGCVAPGETRVWESGNYLPEVPYIVRAQLIDSPDCKGNQVADIPTSISLPNIAMMDQNLEWHVLPIPPAGLGQSDVPDNMLTRQAR